MAVSAIVATAAELSVAELVDEAIWWPGDFGQICSTDGSLGPFESPRIRAYGTQAMQDYFLSKPMIERLKARKSEVSAELVSRLKAFDWEHIPKAPSVSKRVKAVREQAWNPVVKANANGPGPGPWEPQNSKALGGTMLRIILSVGAADTLPELLRLENQLHEINQKAVEATRTAQWKDKKVPAVSLPSIELGGPLQSYDESGTEYREKSGPKTEAWRAWKSKLFGSLVFEREILGTCLAILDDAGYEPLKTSLVGRLRNLGLRKEGLRTKAWLEEAKDADEAKSRVKFDPVLGVPLYPGETTEIPSFEAVRTTARTLIQAFIKGEKPDDKQDGKPLLDAILGTPGVWSQMCSAPAPIPFDAPLVPAVLSVERYYGFTKDQKASLMAYRDKVGPAVIGSLAKLNVKSPPGVVGEGKGTGRQSSDEFGPLLLQTVQILNLVEALPQVLRLENDMHQLMADSERDPKVEIPLLNLDSPVSLLLPANFDREKAKTLRADKNISALFVARVFQREMLGLMSQLMEAEEFQPYVTSPYRAALKAAGVEELKKTLKGMDKVKSRRDWWEWANPSKMLNASVTEWDVDTKSVIIPDKLNPGGRVPYSEASRDALRHIVEEYLKSVPADKRKAADGMHLFWLDQPRY